MKNLLLVRHAKAQEQREFDYDLSRPLIKKGLKDAKKMADKIKGRVSGQVLFITSDANRAFETAHIVAGKLDYPTTRILLKSIIYHDPTPEKFLELIKETDDSYDTIILFGHNPSLSDFASSLIKDFEFDIPKCGVAAFAFGKNSWKEIEKQGGILKFAEYPVRKSEKVGSFENALIMTTSEAILDALEKINPDAASHVLKSITKNSAKLVKNFIDNLKRNKIDKKSYHKTDEKTEHKADEKNKLERDKKSNRKEDKKTDCKAKADKKTDHKQDDKHEHKNEEKFDIEVDEKISEENATNSENSSETDKKDDWGIDEPSTNK